MNLPTNQRLNNVLFFQFIHNQLDSLFGADLDGLAGGFELFGERFEDAGGGTGLTDMLLGDIDAVGIPHFHLFVESGDDTVDRHVAGLDSAVS